MSKKNTAAEMDVTVTEDEMIDAGTCQIDTDFDLESEYKPEPLIPNGAYYGNVTSVSYDKDRCAIVWKVALDGNEGLKSDGESEINGTNLFYRNWMPRPGDENILNKNGTATKRQNKINMLMDFANAMGILDVFKKPQLIANAITDQVWIGLPVLCAITMKEYNGKISNEIKSMKVVESQDD